MPSAPDRLLATDLAGIRLRTPLVLAAGTAGTLDEMRGVCPLEHVGAVVSKSITREPRAGNAVWRILESRVGMLNAIGLANPGIDAFEAEVLPRAAQMPCEVFCSVAGYTVDDYVAVAAALDEWADPAGPGSGVVKAIEINVSCPNVQTGDEFGSTPGRIRELLGAVRPVVRHAKLIIKLSPATPDISVVARAAIEGVPRAASRAGAGAGADGRAGADALTISNTIPAMEIDVETRRPRLANVTGGLSGPALHPVAVRLVHLVYRGVAKETATPILGAGGVTTWRDAAEFILAGATGVQLGTVLFADLGAPAKISRGLAKWVRRQGASSIGELVGAVSLGS